VSSCSDRGQELILASTTSTHDSGLFDVLIPAFEAVAGGIRVKIIAVGTGEALALGRRRDADVLLVHSPADEEAFMRAGHGTRRLPVMRNSYVIVGPAADPAGIRGLDAPAALRAIAAHRGGFVTRGDSSGTHRRELRLWREAGLAPDEVARIDVGQGMGEALMITSERAAYALTDRGTWLALRRRLALDLLVEGGADLANDYSVITVEGARHAAAADRFADWITSPDGAAVIRTYGVDEFGEPLFIPWDSAGG
jgi:tungstate transport system substrate-binding protein